MKFLGKVWLIMILKVTKTRSVTLSSDSIFFEIYSCSWDLDLFLNGTLILVFAKLAIYLNKEELGKNSSENH